MAYIGRVSLALPRPLCPSAGFSKRSFRLPMRHSASYDTLCPRIGRNSEYINNNTNNYISNNMITKGQKFNAISQKFNAIC